jgi:hypothetical protein
MTQLLHLTSCTCRRRRRWAIRAMMPRRRNALHMSTIRCRTLDQFEQARVFLIEEGAPHGSFPVQPG